MVKLARGHVGELRPKMDESIDTNTNTSQVGSGCIAICLFVDPLGSVRVSQKAMNSIRAQLVSGYSLSCGLGRAPESCVSNI